MRLLTFLIFLAACQKQVIHPKRGEIVEAVYGLGTVESEDVYQAKAGVLSSIKEFYVKEGQDVLKDQKLFLVDQGVAIRAPFAGRVTSIPVHIQETIFPQSLILNLVNLEKLYLSVSLEQQAAMKIKKGIKAEISFEFFRNKKIIGTLDTFYPKNSDFIAKVKIDDLPQGVLPGMTADVAFEIDRKKDALLVPTRAIVNGFLTYKHEGKKERVKVKIGLMDMEMAEILEPSLSVEDEILLP